MSPRPCTAFFKGACSRGEDGRGAKPQLKVFFWGGLGWGQPPPPKKKKQNTHKVLAGWCACSMFCIVLCVFLGFGLYGCICLKLFGELGMVVTFLLNLQVLSVV